MVVAGGDNGADSGEMGRVADGGEHLRGSDVGTAEHADFAVGVGERGGPFDGVVAVVGLVLEGIPLALRGVAAADILDDDEVATQGGATAEFNAVVFVVGRALEECGEFSIARRVVDVCAEGDAVAGLHGDSALDGDIGRLCGGEGGSGDDEEAEGSFEHEFHRRRRPRTFYLTGLASEQFELAVSQVSNAKPGAPTF